MPNKTTFAQFMLVVIDGLWLAFATLVSPLLVIWRCLDESWPVVKITWRSSWKNLSRHWREYYNRFPLNK